MPTVGGSWWEGEATGLWTVLRGLSDQVPTLTCHGCEAGPRLVGRAGLGCWAGWRQGQGRGRRTLGPEEQHGQALGRQ